MIPSDKDPNAGPMAGLEGLTFQERLEKRETALQKVLTDVLTSYYESNIDEINEASPGRGPDKRERLAGDLTSIDDMLKKCGTDNWEFNGQSRHYKTVAEEIHDRLYGEILSFANDCDDDEETFDDQVDNAEQWTNDLIEAAKSASQPYGETWPSVAVLNERILADDKQCPQESTAPEYSDDEE